MQKQEIINQIIKQSGLDKNTITNILDIFTNVFIEALKEDGKINLTNIGSFKTKMKEPRLYANPKDIDGKRILSKRKQICKFNMSKKLNNILNANT